ncbi:MAG: hypothetical protein P1U85_10695 [Verrucomicrobiales bacterium]|jgi:hypothetical protein|nr:hypothetical protein [Verrucomicrobiales bacterium]
MEINVGWIALGGMALAAVSGYTGYRIGVQEEPTPVEVAAVVETPEPLAPAPKPEPPREDVSMAEIDALLEEALAEPEPEPEIDEEAMRARQERWQRMTIEQQRMLRKSMFAALSKVDGLEEVGEAIRDGKLDPRSFRLDPESIADRMEFYADTMDQEAMEAEVTRTLQDVVDQARQQMSN